MIRWIVVHQTPQTAPILNSLAHDGLPIQAEYLALDSRGRGWGDVELRHQWREVGIENSAWMLLRGLRSGLDRRTSALVSHGYASTYQVGALLGARISHKPVFMRSDSSHRQELLKGKRKRRAKSAFLKLLLSRERTVAWTVGADNEEYWRQYGMSRTHFIPFESPVPDASDQRLGVEASDDASPTILYVGRLHEVKGLRELRAAGERLHAQGVSFHLRLVGVGPLDSLFRNLPWATLVGALQRSELAAEFAAASVLVVPSRAEPYGLVVREALQFGLPVVATTVVTAARELCDQGWNIVENDPLKIADALRRGLVEPRCARVPPIDVAEQYASALAHFN